MRLRLDRFGFQAERTIGELYAGSEWIAYTMEPGSADKDFPRVDTGFYGLVRHGWDEGTRLKYKRTWALIGADVSPQPEPDISRAAVLFHAGNLDENTKGCILLGLEIGRLQNEMAVVSSRDAMDKLRRVIGGSEAYLTIGGEW